MLTRPPDPEKILRTKTVEFVERGDFGLASGHRPDGTFDRVWFGETVAPDDMTFDAEVFLLKKATATKLKTPAVSVPGENGTWGVLQSSQTKAAAASCANR